MNLISRDVATEVDNLKAFYCKAERHLVLLKQMDWSFNLSKPERMMNGLACRDKQQNSYILLQNQKNV